MLCLLNNFAVSINIIIMKHKVINYDKDFEIKTQTKKSCNKLPYSAEEFYKANIYWIAYHYSFMPMIDFTLGIDELEKIIKKWLTKKNTNHL